MLPGETWTSAIETPPPEPPSAVGTLTPLSGPVMASLYQRFTGRINTSSSFPQPPEASHLLGGQLEDENPARTPQLQHVHSRKTCLREDEDVRQRLLYGRL